MKELNEHIDLKLYSMDQSLGIINCLFDNGYSYYNERNTIETLKKDIIDAFTSESTNKNWFLIYFVRIDYLTKEFIIYTKTINIINIRKDKIKQIQKKLWTQKD